MPVFENYFNTTMNFYSKFINLQTDNIWAFVLLCIGTGIFALLIFRILSLWFWKINKILALLEKIEKNTEKPKTIAMPGYVSKYDKANNS